MEKLVFINPRKCLIFFGICLALLLLTCSSTTKSESNPPDISNHFEAFTEGCSNFTVYSQDSNSTEYVVITGDTSQLKLDTAFKTYSIPEDSAKLSVHYDSVVVNKDSNTTACCKYCISSVATPPQGKQWNAVAGYVDIKRGATLSGTIPAYRITIVLRNMVLREDGSMNEVAIGHLQFDNVLVGWFPD